MFNKFIDRDIFELLATNEKLALKNPSFFCWRVKIDIGKGYVGIKNFIVSFLSNIDSQNISFGSPLIIYVHVNIFNVSMLGTDNF